MQCNLFEQEDEVIFMDIYGQCTWSWNESLKNF